MGCSGASPFGQHFSLDTIHHASWDCAKCALPQFPFSLFWGSIIRWRRHEEHLTLMDYNSKHAFLLSSVKGQCYDVYCFLKDFHQLSQNLLLWLASAESRRQKAHVTDPQAGPRVLLECQEELRVSFFLSVSALARASVRSALSPAWCFWEEQRQCAVLPHASGCPLGIPLWSCSRGTGRDEELWPRAGSLQDSGTGDKGS